MADIKKSLEFVFKLEYGYRQNPYEIEAREAWLVQKRNEFFV